MSKANKLLIVGGLAGLGVALWSWLKPVKAAPVPAPQRVIPPTSMQPINPYPDEDTLTMGPVTRTSDGATSTDKPMTVVIHSDEVAKTQNVPEVVEVKS